MGLENFRTSGITLGRGNKAGNWQNEPEVIEAIDHYGQNHPNKKFICSREISNSLDVLQRRVTHQLDQQLEDWERWSRSSNNPYYVNPYFAKQADI